MRVSSSEESSAGRTPPGRIDQFVLQVGDRVGQQPRREPLDVQPHVAADHLQQTPRIVGVIDGEVRVEAVDQRRLVAQDAHAGRVKRRHPHRAGPVADQAHHAFAHLGGGLVGEGDGQNLADPDAAGRDQVGDAPRQHRRLARAGARHDQQRRALMHHRLALLRVEAVEQLVRFGLARVTGRVHSHVGPNLPPPADGSASRHAFKSPTKSQLSLESPEDRPSSAGPVFAQERPLVAHSVVLNRQRRFFYGYRPAVPVV